MGALALAGFKGVRQGHEGRVGQVIALMGFCAVLLIIADFLPPQVLEAVIAFVAIGGAVALYNLQSYLTGSTESSDWYDFYWRVFGSLTLATILLVLILEYVVGIDLPILP